MLTAIQDLMIIVSNILIRNFLSNKKLSDGKINQEQRIFMNEKKIGSKLAKVRRKMNLKQYQVAEKCGVPTTTYHNYESNKRSVDLIFFRTFCKEFNVNEDWLLTGEGEMFLDKGAVGTQEEVVALRKRVEELTAEVSGLRKKNMELSEEYIIALRDLSSIQGRLLRIEN